MRLARLLLATSGLLLVAGSAEAQRAPVLRQVKTPHPYYFREMLIPQLRDEQPFFYPYKRILFWAQK